jgi:hypothetical protein
MLFPDAVQRVAVLRRSGIVPPNGLSKRTRKTLSLERSRVCSAPLRKGYVLRSAREKCSGHRKT